MPLRWRLVAIYTVVLAAVVAGFSTNLVLLLRASLERGVAKEVEARTQAVGAVVEFENGAWGVEAKAGLDPQFDADSGLYYQVADGQGTVLVASPLARTLLLVPAPPPGERIRQTGDRRLLEITLDVEKPVDEGEPPHATTLRVTCGKDLREVDATIGSLVQLLAWLGPLVLVLSLAGGLFLAGRALRPIDEIARTAAAIGAHDLAQRIPVHGRDELAALATTLNGTFDRLQQAFERQVRFTADASHELRTPLAVVAGNAELALARDRSPEEQRDLLREIRAAAAQMQSLIEGLLTLARADHDGFAGEEVHLAPLCADAVRAGSALAAEHQVALRSDGVADLAVRGDRGCLLQMLQNLIGNAVRYNRPGGHVVVQVRPGDGGAEIEVRDDGIGIPAGALPHVGERFFRVDPSRTRSTGGVGLGLSICKAIVAAHGGRLRILSSEGEGTRVLVTLPAR